MIENAMVIPISTLIYEGFMPLMNWWLIKHLVVGGSSRDPSHGFITNSIEPIVNKG